MGKKRILSIDVLKVIAVIIVLNSHMELSYGQYSFLATGGAIGDALFFFCSGFTILMKEVGSFPNFYKKRIARIYPTVFAVAIVVSIFFREPRLLVDDVILGSGWFVNCIMLYYIPLYFIRKFFMEHFKWIWIFTSLIIVVSFYLFFFKESSEYFMYGSTYYKWIFFFLFMVYGGYVGKNHEKYKYNWWCIPKLLLCITIWYGFFLIPQIGLPIMRIQYLSLLPLLGVIHYFYILCNHSFLLRLADSKITGQLLYIVGGLCLEVYLIQVYLFTDSLNSIFPLNIPIIMLVVIVVSYLINVFSNLIAQTFKSEDYNWGKMYLHR